jgi:hypothetical protein
MRYTLISTILLAVVMSGCDAGTPTESVSAVKAPTLIKPSAFLTEAQILRLTFERQIGKTTIRMYAENFHEVGQPCNEVVTIDGSTIFTTTYSQTTTGYTLKVLIASAGKGFGTPSGDKYWKYYINYQKDLGRIDGSPERDFTLIQDFKITRQGDVYPEDDAVGKVYYHIRVNNLGEILELTETSSVECI